MKGYKGYVEIRASDVDAHGYYTKVIPHKFHIFENLNHSVIVGRNFMRNSGVRKIVKYPGAAKI